MYSVVQVLEVRDDSTVVVGCSSAACQGCKAEMFCNNKNQTSYSVLNEAKLPVQAGDWVEIFLPPGKTILSTVMVFGFPLILFPIGYFLMRFLLKTGELFSAVGGLAGMSLAFLVTSLISTKKKKSLMPQIIKKI